MTIVKKAASAFQQGDYANAERLYQQAAERYGKHLFAANITLCQRGSSQRLAGSKSTGPIDNQHQTTASSSVERQLSETQKLLEYYFTRCQELEYQQSER